MGLVASLARPGGNVTGVANMSGSVTAKRLQLLHELVPGATRIAYLTNPAVPGWDRTVKTVEDAGARVTVRWPDSPDVVFLRGGTVAGLLVAGQHSDVAEAAWRLGAVVRVFALAGTPWLWPESIAGPSGALPAQTELVAAASTSSERTTTSESECELPVGDPEGDAGAA